MILFPRLGSSGPAPPPAQSSPPSEPEREHHASVGAILRLWLPLAISFELMMLEGPAVQGAIGRLPDSRLHLAAWGLTMSLSLLIESPVIMLLATSIALVRDAPSYFALRRFMLNLAVGCTALTALVAFTPLFSLVAVQLMGQPEPIADAARPALQIMLLWTAAIAWRRFYQGILVRSRQTQRVSHGTAIRLMSAVITAIALVAWGKLPGAQVASITLIVAVITEAIATTLFAMPVVRSAVLPNAMHAPPLTQRGILQFHGPLAATTLLTLLAQPLTAAALARLPMPERTLAAWPVASMLLLVMRGGGLAMQEITVAQAHNRSAHDSLRKAAWLIGGATSALTVLITFTPLLSLYFDRVLHLRPDLQSETRLAISLGCLLPLIASVGSWARGMLVASGSSRTVYRGMAINLAAHGALLTLGVLLQVPGIWTAIGALSAAAIIEYLYLIRQTRSRPHSVPHC